VRVLDTVLPVPIRSQITKLERIHLEAAHPPYAMVISRALEAASAHTKAASRPPEGVPAALASALKELSEVRWAANAETVLPRRFALYAARERLCSLCPLLPEGHPLTFAVAALEQAIDATLERWPAEHAVSAAHCQSAFAADADLLQDVAAKLHATVHVQHAAKS